MHTKQSLMDDLYRMHAPQNLPVIVHTSLKKIGACEDGAEGVLSVLIDYFTKDGGLLIIPTHTWRNLSHPSAYTLDMTPVGQAEVRACIGVLPSVAAYHPLAHRSRHPTHSVAVFDGTPAGTPGRAEDYIRRDDRECGSSTHPDGCFGSLYALGGKVLLLGVGQQNDTFLHAIEEIVGVPGRLMEEARVLTVRLPDGTVIEKRQRCHCGGVSGRYPKFEPAFWYHGAIVDGMFGDAKTQLCDARRMTQTIRQIKERAGDRDLLLDDAPLEPSLYE